MNIQDWGRIDYEAALKKQMALVESIETNQSDSTIVFCSHPPVVTLGRGTKDGDVFAWEGPTVEVSRGGRATYHGPNQLVMYPILNINKQKDLNLYLRHLEGAVVGALTALGCECEIKTTQADEGGPSLTGVWAGEYKIASIGVAIRKWITYHGVAINLDQDENAFHGINPCGFLAGTMKSVEEILGRKLDRENLKFELATRLSGKAGNFTMKKKLKSDLNSIDMTCEAIKEQLISMQKQRRELAPQYIEIIMRIMKDAPEETRRQYATQFYELQLEQAARSANINF